MTPAPDPPEERLSFYETLLALPYNSAANLLQQVADEWRKFSGSLWTWLWMFNDFGEPSRWEIVAVSPNQDPRYLPEDLTITSSSCVAELAWRSQIPVFIGNMDGKIIGPDGQGYDIASKKAIRSFGAKCFQAVPLLTPPQNPGERESIVQRAVLCMHYEENLEQSKHPDRNLLLLGRITALKIAAAFEADKKRVLLKLNELSERYLTQGGIFPESLRSEYCSKLIPIITEYVGSEWASIFYRDYQFNHLKISCLATTGLIDGEEKHIPTHRLSSVRYDKGENVTGTVFSTGSPVIAKIGDGVHSAHQCLPKYREITADMQTSDVSWMMYPIVKKQSSKEPEILGVLRCVGSKPAIAGRRPGNFTQQQAQIMDFIANQIAPVLETFERQISRETQIAMVRHDMADPITALTRDLKHLGRYLLQHDCIAEEARPRNRELLQRATKLDAANFERWLGEKTSQPLRYELSNLFVQHHLLSQVSHELHHEQLVEYKPEKTNIEKKILAPLKSIYWHIAQESKGMGIRFDGFESPYFPLLWVDPVQIQRVITNLLTNAIKYGKAKSTIEVTARDLRGDVGIAVTNEGEGIDEEEQERIFEGRYRTPWAVTRANGAGLGLKISRAIVQRHGGTLTVQSSPSGPTEFLIIFPQSLKFNPNF